MLPSGRRTKPFARNRRYARIGQSSGGKLRVGASRRIERSNGIFAGMAGQAAAGCKRAAVRLYAQHHVDRGVGLRRPYDPFGWRRDTEPGLHCVRIGRQVAFVEQDQVGLRKLLPDGAADITVGGAAAHGFGVGEYNHTIQSESGQKSDRPGDRAGKGDAARLEQDMVRPRFERRKHGQ